VAEVVDGFPESGRNAKFPWDEWFDGQVRRLEHGVDFDSKPSSFRSAANGVAARRGHGVRVKVVGGSVFLQRSDDPPKVRVSKPRSRKAKVRGEAAPEPVGVV